MKLVTWLQWTNELREFAVSCIVEGRGWWIHRALRYGHGLWYDTSPLCGTWHGLFQESSLRRQSNISIKTGKLPTAVNCKMVGHYKEQDSSTSSFYTYTYVNIHYSILLLFKQPMHIKHQLCVGILDFKQSILLSLETFSWKKFGDDVVIMAFQ